MRGASHKIHPILGSHIEHIIEKIVQYAFSSFVRLREETIEFREDFPQNCTTSEVQRKPLKNTSYYYY